MIKKPGKLSILQPKNVKQFNKFFVNIASEIEKTIPPADQPL